MPAKNRQKKYVDKGYYHLYNRGVAKTAIFLDNQDYATFINYLAEYLSPFISPDPEEMRQQSYRYIRKNYHGHIELVAFVLMPNHFHFLVKQNESREIESFMRSISTRYSKYFNKKYARIGHLMQDIYKGILITNEEYFLWLSRYIHLNPIKLLKNNVQLASYIYSSYPSYLGIQKLPWVYEADVLSGTNNYQKFVETETNPTSNPEPTLLAKLALDYE